MTSFLGFHHDTYKKSSTSETGLTEVINSLKNRKYNRC